jgi:hypothetical protein
VVVVEGLTLDGDAGCPVVPVSAMEVAPVTVQLRVDVWPCGMLVGLALNVAMTGG